MCSSRSPYERNIGRYIRLEGGYFNLGGKAMVIVEGCEIV